MTDIGTLVIRLEAQTASLQAGLNSARRQLDAQTSLMQRSFVGLQSAANRTAVAIGNIGAVLGVAGMVAFARKAVETAGGLGELADQLGVTTDSLQALQYQALQSGASAETLEAGIARLTRSIGDAGEGNDALIARFRELGVGILDATGKLRPTEDVLGDVAKAISGIADPAKQAAAVVDLFGKSGQKLLPVLRDVSDVGLEGLVSKAREAGVVIDEALIKRFDELSDRAAMKAKIATIAVADSIGKIVDYVNGLDATKAALLASVIGAGVGYRFGGLPGAAAGAAFAGQTAYLNWPEQSADTKMLAEQTRLRARIQSLLDEQYKLRMDASMMGGQVAPIVQSEIEMLQRQIDVAARSLETVDKAIDDMRRANATSVARADISETSGLPSVETRAAEAPRLPRSSRELNNELGAEKLIESLRLQRDSYGLLESAILRMRLERERDQQVVNGLIVDLGPKFTKTQIDAAVGVQKQVEALARLREELGQWFADAKEQEAALMRQGDAWRDLAARRSEFDRSTARNLANAARETELIAQSAVVWNRYTQQFERANRVVEIHREEQRILAENLALTDDAARELAERIVAANEAQREAIQKVDAEVKRQQQSYELLSGMGERAFDRIGDAATAMALEGQDAFSSLRNVARAVIASIYSDFMKLAIANPIKNAIFGGNSPTLGGGGLNGVFAGLFGGGGGQAAGNSVATVGNPGAGFTGGTFARGGRPPIGRASWVGEEGPELFVPDVAGRIYPHDESMAMAGGGGDTYMIDARGADERGLMRVEALIRQLNGSIEKRAVLAVGSAMNRGSFP
jgi:hypothetical protein